MRDRDGGVPIPGAPGPLHPLTALRVNGLRPFGLGTIAAFREGGVMQRRGKSLTEVQREFYYNFFEATAASRQQAIRENEKRRLRKSM